jgi:hypothetical protein
VLAKRSTVAQTSPVLSARGGWMLMRALPGEGATQLATLA